MAESEKIDIEDPRDGGVIHISLIPRTLENAENSAVSRLLKTALESAVQADPDFKLTNEWLQQWWKGMESTNGKYYTKVNSYSLDESFSDEDLATIQGRLLGTINQRSVVMEMVGYFTRWATGATGEKHSKD